MKIRQPKILPVYRYPSTVYFIDDDLAFLKMLKAKLQQKFIVKYENDANKALNFLNNEYKQPNLIINCFTSTQTSLREPAKTTVDVSKLHHHIYDKNRFSEITTTVSDFAMPGKTGFELLDQVKTSDHPINPSMHTIMLSGVLRSPENLQRNATIEAFYNKNESTEKLEEQIAKAQQAYFEDGSISIENALLRDPENKTTCFADEKFAQLVENYIREHDIVEYYLLDKQGSLLFLDRNAHLSWLIVRNIYGINNTTKYAKEHGASPDIINMLQSQKHLLYIPDETAFNANSGDWSDYIYAAQVLDGHEKYYYAFVTDLKHHNIDSEKILSYEDYLESL